MNWRLTGMVLGTLGFVALIAFLLVFQDNIVRFQSSPKAPFQTTTPPPSPEYGARGAWLLWPTTSDRPADVFYIHSTTYYEGRLWNAPLDDEKADKIRRTEAAPNEAGPFSAVGNLYGPRYREATLFSQFTHKYDGLAAQHLAYADIRRAFEEFLRVRDQSKPLILVGYGQGGLHALGLLRDYFQGDNNALRAHLAVAYIIGYATPVEYLSSLTPAIPACQTPTDVRCVVSYSDLEPRFDEEMARLRNRSLIWAADGALVSSKANHFVCTNPLTWTTGSEYQPAELHIGAASATGIGYGSSPPVLAKTVGARCDNGVLIVDPPRQTYLRRGVWFGAKWKIQPFNLFYFDLEKNTGVRLSRLKEILHEEAQILEPIEESIDLGVSPVNKVPPL